MSKVPCRSPGSLLCLFCHGRQSTPNLIAMVDNRLSDVKSAVTRQTQFNVLRRDPAALRCRQRKVTRRIRSPFAKKVAWRPKRAFWRDKRQKAIEEPALLIRPLIVRLAMVFATKCRKLIFSASW